MSFLDRVRALAAPDLSGWPRFRVGAAAVGWVRPAFAPHLAAFPDVFRVGGDQIALHERLAGPEARTLAVAQALAALAARGLIPGWRGEAYPVGTSFAAPQLFAMERAAVPLFGVRAYGVHLNGFVRDERGAISLWVARRSLTKANSPGKLDQLVGGGQPAGIGLRQNLIKEAAEEASLPAEWAARALAVGAVSYLCERPEGLRNDVLYAYDLELPADFRPVNTDGEIASFHLWPIERVIAAVRDTDDFKFNCSLIVIDFLIRHGFIEPDHPDYLDLVWGLRRRAPEVP